MTTLAVGQPAPTFNLLASSGQPIALDDWKGQSVVLYFYPKDCTSGCTLEGQDFRDHHDQFVALNAVILGVSRDTVALHQKFKTDQRFPFELLADTDGVICERYEVIKPKTMYGRRVQGIERSTFLIDSDGILRREWHKVKVEGHVAEVLQALKEIV
jgi:peroxiredoxin Q/BCP